jgi:hypothetical protein
MIAMDFSNVLGQFMFPGGLDITRSAAGSYDSAGLWQDSSNVVHFPIIVVTPATKEQIEVLDLPEGERVEHALWLAAPQAFHHSSVAGHIRGDRFTYDGDRYEIKAHGPWMAQAGFEEATAIKVTQ